MNLLRIVVAQTACLLLSGCFLMSAEPRFGDTQAVALLGPDSATYWYFGREAEGWKLSDLDRVQMVPDGNHYLLHDPTGSGSLETDPIVHFVPLDADHWLMQLTFPDAGHGIQTYFGVATGDEAELLVTSITCEYLRDRPGITDHVSFTEDDCSLPLPAKGEEPDFPALLWQNLPPPDTRLVLQP
jgi:hypothetical protein